MVADSRGMGGASLIAAIGGALMILLALFSWSQGMGLSVVQLGLGVLLVGFSVFWERRAAASS